MPRCPNASPSGTRRRARRQFSARVFIDHGSQEPQTIIFPCSSYKYEDVDADVSVAEQDSDDEEIEIAPQSTAGLSAASASGTASTSASASSSSSANPKPPANTAAGSRILGDTECPYDCLRDRRFYAKQHTFHYFTSAGKFDIPFPPEHPPTMDIKVNTVFTHLNTASSLVQSWRRHPGQPGQGDTWKPVQAGEEIKFPHGKYHYSVSQAGIPSWIVYNTLRKKKYPTKKRKGKGREADLE